MARSHRSTRDNGALKMEDTIEDRTGAHQEIDIRLSKSSTTATMTWLMLLERKNVSEGEWDQMCETIQAEVEAAEQGHDTLYDEKGRLACTHSAGERIRTTVMSVEEKLPSEKRQFFREDAPSRPQGLSYGNRAQPKPNPESP